MRKRRWDKERFRERSRRGMYIIPSFFTVSNIFCGFFSVSSSIQGNYERAGLLIGIAMILDTLDGRMARLTGTTSDFGVQLDSLADVITFGMAPAVLCYQWAFYRYELHALDRAGWLVCFLFLICAASRLARFNVQSNNVHDKRYFIGMPTPPAAGFVAAAIYYAPQRLDGTIPAVVTLLIMALLSFLMVSTIRYRSFKDLNLRQPRSYRTTVVIALVIVGLALDLKKALITLAIIYTVSGFVGLITGRQSKHAADADPDTASLPLNPT